ncbi:MAG: hypothetical protein Q7J79_01550, partial [Gemmatimonadales bacterium]|nr:hypothetical protein [Gemmatimonadales bacterium]
MANVLAVTEQRDGALRKVSREVVWAARQLADALGGSVDAIVVGGPGVDAPGAGLGEVGADRVLVATHATFARYAPDGYASTIVSQAKAGGYAAVVVGATATGRDLAPRLAVRLDVPLATDVTAIEVAEGKVRATRPVYAGKAIQQLEIDATPALVSIRPNTFTPGQSPRAGTVENISAVADAAR